MLSLYLRNRIPGRGYEELRRFLRSSLSLANARTHSSQSGVVGAFGAAQGLLGFIRVLEALAHLDARETVGKAPA
jgi:hypothetical protein